MGRGRPRKYPVADKNKTLIKKPEMKNRSRHLNQKLNNDVTSLFSALEERRKLGVQEYFRGLSLNSVLMMIVILLTGLLAIKLPQYIASYHQSPFIDGMKYQGLFYIPFAAALIMGFLLFDNKAYQKLINYVYPAFTVITVINFLVKANVITIVTTSLLGLMCGYLFTICMLYLIFVFDRAERLVTLIVFCLLYFGRYSIGIIVQHFTTKLIFFFIFDIVISIICSVIVVFIKKDIVLDIKIDNDRIAKFPHVFAIIIFFIVLFNYGIMSGINNYLTTNMPLLVDRNYPHAAYIIGLVFGVLISTLTFIYSRKGYIKIVDAFFITLLLSYLILVMLFTNVIIGNEIKVLISFVAVFALGVLMPISIFLVIMLVGKLLSTNATKELVWVYVLFLSFYLIGTFLLSQIIGSTDKSFVELDNALMLMMVINLALFGFGIAVNFNRLDAKENEGQVEVYQKYKDNYKKIDPKEVLTKKEYLVFGYLIQGLTLKQVSDACQIKYDAANFHYKNIYKKLEVNSKLELILRYGNETREIATTNNENETQES